MKIIPVLVLSGGLFLFVYFEFVGVRVVRHVADHDAVAGGESFHHLYEFVVAVAQCDGPLLKLIIGCEDKHLVFAGTFEI